MGMTLHLGVLDIPYKAKTEFEQYARTMAKALGDSYSADTTGDVAEILEAHYHIMEIFTQAHGDEIADDLTEGFQGTLESLLSNRPVDPGDVFNAGTAKIELRFRDFLMNREMEYLSGLAGGTTGISPIPTKAALKGVNHRLAHPYAASNPRRPSFIDTGLYEQSMKAWVDGEPSE